MDLVTSVSATGTIESAATKTVSAQLNNITVSEVLVQVGDTVHSGDTLIRFDLSDLEESLSDANENLSDTTNTANDEIEDAQKQLNDAEDTYSSEKTKQAEKVADAKEALSEVKSAVKKLQKQVDAESDPTVKASLEEQLAKAQETVTQAEKAYEEAQETQTSTNKQNKSNVENAEKSLENAKSNKEKSVKEAQKQVDSAQEALDSCSITAPISGIITSVNVEAGDTYNGGTLFQIDDVSSFTVTTSVDEYDITNVSVGQRVVILTDATDDTELEGEITFVAPSTSSSQTADAMSGSDSSGYEVNIDILTADDRLRMGMTAKCSIVLEEAKDVFAVPYDAVHTDADGSQYIFVMDTQADSTDNTQTANAQPAEEKTGTRGEHKNVEYASYNMKRISVTVGMESDYYVEISGDDLSEGLRVVIPTDETETTDSSDKQDDAAFPFGSGNMPGSGTNPNNAGPTGNPKGTGRGGSYGN